MRLGYETTHNVIKFPNNIVPETTVVKTNLANITSTLSQSFTNLFIILPYGVVSKKRIYVLRMLCTVFIYIFLLALMLKQ